MKQRSLEHQVEDKLLLIRETALWLNQYDPLSIIQKSFTLKEVLAETATKVGYLVKNVELTQLRVDAAAAAGRARGEKW